MISLHSLFPSRCRVAQFLSAACTRFQRPRESLLWLLTGLTHGEDAAHPAARQARRLTESITRELKLLHDMGFNYAQVEVLLPPLPDVQHQELQARLLEQLSASHPSIELMVRRDPALTNPLLFCFPAPSPVANTKISSLNDHDFSTSDFSSPPAHVAVGGSRRASRRANWL